MKRCFGFSHRMPILQKYLRNNRHMGANPSLQFKSMNPLALPWPMRLEKVVYMLTRYEKSEVSRLVAQGLFDVYTSDTEREVHEISRQTLVYPGETVFVKGNHPLPQPKFQSIAFYKPKGVRSEFGKSEAMQTFVDSIDPITRHNQVVHSEELMKGLAIISSDGYLVRAIQENQVEQEYIISARPRNPSANHNSLQKLIDPGVLIFSQRRFCISAEVLATRRIKPPGEGEVQTQYDIRVVHKEHADKITKKMLKKVGFWVDEIERVRYGPISAKELEMTEDFQHVVLSSQQEDALWKACGGKTPVLKKKYLQLEALSQKNDDRYLWAWLQRNSHLFKRS